MVLKLASIAALMIACASPAFAAQDRDPVNFHFNRADLATADGAEALYKRMTLRAKNKCDPRDDFTAAARDRCARDLVGQWVEAIGDKRLAGIHDREG